MICGHCGKEYNSSKALEKHYVKCASKNSLVSVCDLQGNELFNKHNVPAHTLSDFEKIHSEICVIPPTSPRVFKHITAVKKMLSKRNITEMEAHSIYIIVSHFYPHFSRNEVHIAHEKVVGFYPPERFRSGRLVSPTISIIPDEIVVGLEQRKMDELVSFLDNYN